MSRTLRIRPTGAAAILGVMIGAVALAGCGAGQITQTSSQVAAVGGANVTVGAIAIRDAEIEFPEGTSGNNSYPTGSSAPLRMVIVNSGTQADRLVSASSPVAQSVQVSSGAEIVAGRSLSIEGKPAPVATPTPTGAPSTGTTASNSPGASATPRPTTAPSGSATPTAAPTTSVAAGSEREVHVVLTGLRQDVRAGLVYEVVLTFEKAGPIKVNVPVGNPGEPRKDEHS